MVYDVCLHQLFPLPMNSEHPVPKVFLFIFFFRSPIPFDHKTVHVKADLNLFPCAIWWRLFLNAQ